LQAADPSRTELLLWSLALFVVLGALFDGYTIVILAVPLLQPVLESHGIDMIWFGVITVILIEMSMISPPVGMAVFAVKSIAPDIPISKIFRGILPFWTAMFVAIALIAAFPSIALYVPRAMLQ
jgi:TRAP-type C4-dicarboxylate transport system permease large subunit